MLDILMLLAIFGYWFIAIYAFEYLRGACGEGQTKSVVLSALWPLLAILNVFRRFA